MRAPAELRQWGSARIASHKQLPWGCTKLTDALSCRPLDGGSVQMIGRVSMLTQAISFVLLCLGVAAFVADSALGPPMLATAIAAWLVMPDVLMHR